MPRRIVKDKKELYQELKSFFGEETYSSLKHLERRSARHLWPYKAEQGQGT